MPKDTFETDPSTIELQYRSQGSADVFTEIAIVGELTTAAQTGNANASAQPVSAGGATSFSGDSLTSERFISPRRDDGDEPFDGFNTQ